VTMTTTTSRVLARGRHRVVGRRKMPEPGNTGLYVYGVTPSTASPVPAHLHGMDGHAVELVTSDGLGAVVTEISLPRPPGRRRDLLSHSEVLNALAVDCDVVPLRFGTVFPDADAVAEDLLIRGATALTDLVQRVRGAVQLNLRASYVEERVLAEVVAGNREIRELRARTQHLPEGTPHPDALQLGRLVSLVLTDLRREDSAMLAECVLPLVRESRTRERGATDHVLDMAMLVDRANVAEVETELESMAGDVHDRIHLQLTGPLAPFDFVEEAAWA
jgi:Gas vesicle synthesis protein GvpL/GvpF